MRPPYALARWIREEHPGVGVLVVIPRNRACYLAWAVRAGATGILTAEEMPELLAETVCRAAKEESTYTEEQIEQAKRWWREVGEKWECLTEREREVLEEMVRGRANREIAAALGVAEKTVEKHVTEILGKLGVQSRVEAVLWVLRNGVWDWESEMGFDDKKVGISLLTDKVKR
ncbi:MAG: response regulator transcription factor [Anaerolineae bacterium]|nr:response regulator transcription factor [Anaerolineae bacterium]